jgi:DNA-binding Lrp family transcriptional regulator
VVALDDLDHRILHALSDDSRQPASAVARRLGVPRTTVQARIARLERGGVIAGYTVRPGPAADDGGRAVTAHVAITVDPKLASSVVGALSRIDEVRTVHTVSGPFDLIAVVSAASTTAVDGVLDRIGAVAGVERTTSAILLTTRIDR